MGRPSEGLNLRQGGQRREPLRLQEPGPHPSDEFVAVGEPLEFQKPSPRASGGDSKVARQIFREQSPLPERGAVHECAAAHA